MKIQIIKQNEHLINPYSESVTVILKGTNTNTVLLDGYQIFYNDINHLADRIINSLFEGNFLKYGENTRYGEDTIYKTFTEKIQNAILNQVYTWDFTMFEFDISLRKLNKLIA